MTEAKEKLQAAINELGLTVVAAFIPYSKSEGAQPNPKLNELRLNWQVAIKRGNRIILETPYSAGVAYCPSYKQSGSYTVDEFNAILRECETGHDSLGKAVQLSGRKIEPDPCDVISSLALDASVLDSGGFEAWASECGYDTDSRKAEQTYRTCLDLALKLRAGIGEEGLKKLREAAQDY